MKNVWNTLVACLFGALAVVACSSSSSSTPAPASSSGGEEADAGETTEDAGATPGTQCSAAREQLLVPIDKVSQAQVSIVSTSGNVKKIYVEAAAGGQAGAAKNPRVYVDLSTGSRVDVTDKSALTSTAWDLALKRTVIFTNGGDAGPGQGAGGDALKAFDAVTAADATKAKPEKFFDAECNPQTDPIGGPATTFSDWYEYNQANNNTVTPRDTTYVVRGGTGKLFKVKILTFTANPDGTTNRTATGYFLLDVAEL